MTELVVKGGLIGFPAWERFRVENSSNDKNLRHLVLLDDAQVMISIYRIDALNLSETYTIDLDTESASEAVEKIGSVTGSEAWAVLVRYETPGPHITANLRAPLLINWVRGQAAQVVQETDYPLRHIVAGRHNLPTASAQGQDS